MADQYTELIDMSPQILEAFKRQVMNGLAAIGTKCEKHAKDDCPVDTGRLRNSITYATARTHSAGQTQFSGRDGKGGTANPGDWALKGSPDDHAVYIGTNVEYAEQQEYFDMAHQVGRAHFLRDAATTHGDEYKKAMEAALKA